jgi:hypothetical protein
MQNFFDLWSSSGILYCRAGAGYSKWKITTFGVAQEHLQGNTALVPG